MTADRVLLFLVIWVVLWALVWVLGRTVIRVITRRAPPDETESTPQPIGTGDTPPAAEPPPWQETGAERLRRVWEQKAETWRIEADLRQEALQRSGQARAAVAAIDNRRRELARRFGEDLRHRPGEIRHHAERVRRHTRELSPRVEAVRTRVGKVARQALAALESAIRTIETAPEYLAASDVDAWQTRNATILDPARWAWIERHLDVTDTQKLKRLREQLATLPRTVRAANDRFVRRRLTEDREAFDLVEQHPLTTQQRRAIVTNEDTTLVIAGAGTGKTSTIIGRVDYLVRRGLARPEQILVLAYNAKAADELRNRLKRLNVDEGAAIHTFHALGMKVIGLAAGKRPTLSPLREDQPTRRRFFRDRVREALADDHRRSRLMSFFTEHLIEDQPVDPSRTGDQMIQEERRRGLRAIDGTKLRSQQEVVIANWLIFHGIAWDYERPYPVDTATPWKRQYLPDFYLPEHDIYLEHFGINRTGHTAPYINAKRYKAAMTWKRELHQKHGTRLLETYSYDFDGNMFNTHLERILRAEGVEPRRLTDNDIAPIIEAANRPISDFINLIDTFVTLFKGSGADRAEVEARAESPRDRVFLDIFWPIFDAYQARLAERQQIDFDDMINLARRYIQTGGFRSDYTHIIVDEFQDISENRLGLLLDLRAQQPARLFVVGDDWQSIYRFTGSDVGIITHLAERVGATERIDLDTAFRYPQELLGLTTTFVTANPDQLRKDLTAYQGRSGEPPVAVILAPRYEDATESPSLLQHIADDSIRRAGNQPADVLVLGRYNSDEPKAFRAFKAELARRRIDVSYSTVHSAKGKEADFVVVVEVKAGERGFPSGISNDSVLRMVLTAGGETFADAEERRLFYVALTRARKHVYVVAPEDAVSPFLRDELLSEAYRPWVETMGVVRERLVCPRCQGKTIRRVAGENGGFWGCANHPMCQGTLETCRRCGDGAIVGVESGHGRRIFRCTNCQAEETGCPQCGDGYLVLHQSRYGPFQRCSTWQSGGQCQYKRDVSVSPQLVNEEVPF